MFSTLASLVDIPIQITSSAIWLKICPITAGIKIYKWIIQKKEKKHSRIVLLVKSNLSSTEVLRYKPFIGSVISHDESFVINNVLKEYDKARQEIKKSNNK